MIQIEQELRQVVAAANKSNGHEKPSILSNVDKVNQMAGEAISRTGEELADFIEKAGAEAMSLAQQYESESKKLAGEIRELYKDETKRLNHFLVKIQELRDAMTEAQMKFTGAELPKQ